jgi:hypothetical protein
MLWENLYGDKAVQPGVFSAVDLSHAAHSNRVLNLIRAEPGRGR